LELSPGSSRRFDSHWLGRWPGPRALGLSEALAGRTAEGARLWIESTGTLQLRQPEFRGWMQSLVDFERLHRERGERERAETLVRRGAAAAGVAHDLRNQLSLAALEFDRIRELGDLRAGSEELSRALREAQALSHSFLGRDGAGGPTKALRGLLEEELRSAIELAGRTAVGARLRCARGLATLVDEVLLRRILRNLLLNALQATDDGGRVQLSGIVIDDERVEVVVEDDGRGMDERQLERWMRAGSSGRGSTGFGTTSVLDCVREIGAELAIESTPGEGTRCAVVIARAEAGERSAVLVCEPDPVRRRRITRRIEGLGLRTVGCADALRSRALFQAHGALALCVARGLRDAAARDLRHDFRAAELPNLELSVRDDEMRTIGAFCARIQPPV